MPRPEILLLSLGGTITMTPSEQGGIAPTLTAADLIRAVPELDAVADIEAISPKRLPGASLTLDDLLEIAGLIEDRLGAGADGVVVAQGTDTIEETAFVLDLLVTSDKPVVVTGAMRGPEMPGADGPANLHSSVIVASAPGAVGLGSLVVLNDQIHSARLVQKSHTTLPSAFKSPLSGPIGIVAEGRASIFLRPRRTPALVVPRTSEDKPVALVKLCLGEDGRILQALPGLGYHGVVIEGMGAGHVPAVVSPLIGDLVASLPVVLSMRVQTGPVLTRTYGYPGSETDLIGRGVLPSGILSSLKARLLLSLLLRAGGERHSVERAFREYALLVSE